MSCLTTVNFFKFNHLIVYISGVGMVSAIHIVLLSPYNKFLFSPSLWSHLLCNTLSFMSENERKTFMDLPSTFAFFQVFFSFCGLEKKIKSILY